MRLDLTQIIGKQFGNLTVQSLNSYRRGHYILNVICTCGKALPARYASLANGHAKSCGCERSKVGNRNAALFRTHSSSNSRTYRIWSGMWGRCTNPRLDSYRNYGGRGVTVCERWNRFEKFLADMGHAPNGLTIERIDNDQGYSPRNCRWATRAEQTDNRRNTIRYELNGKILTIKEWSHEIGIDRSTLYHRVRHLGWSVQSALTMPPLWRRK